MTHTEIQNLSAKGQTDFFTSLVLTSHS